MSDISKETTFTEGPWTPHLNTGSPPFVTRSSDNSGWICQTVTWCGLDEAKANATFIAAAPDMFEVCASVWCELAVTDDPVLRKLADEARNAIAKARGEDRSHEGKGA